MERELMFAYEQQVYNIALVSLALFFFQPAFIMHCWSLLRKKSEFFAPFCWFWLCYLAFFHFALHDVFGFKAKLTFSLIPGFLLFLTTILARLQAKAPWKLDAILSPLEPFLKILLAFYCMFCVLWCWFLLEHTALVIVKYAPFSQLLILCVLVPIWLHKFRNKQLLKYQAFILQNPTSMPNKHGSYQAFQR